MTVTADSIRAMFPEFVSGADDYINIFISSAKLMICESMYGPRYDLAVSYLTAHLMKTSSDNGSGEVSKEKVGDLSREFKSGISYNSSNGSGYSSTTYGTQFLTIRKSLVNHLVRPIYGSKC